MELSAEVVAGVPAEVLFAEVESLDRYPRWLEIIRRAELVSGPDDAEPAWSIDLRARIGPLARSKRLRMVRVHVAAPRTVRFERRELDRRQHSSWVLEAEVEPVAEGSRLTMHLHYGGALLAPVVERVLREEIERSRSRLLDLLTPR